MALRPLFGQIIETAIPADIQLILAGDRELADERDRLFRGWAIDSRDLRANLLSSESALQTRMEHMLRVPGTGLPKSYGGFVRDGTRLTVQGQRAMEGAIRRGMRESFQGIEEVIEARVGRASRRSMRLRVNRMEEMGFPPLSSDSKRMIQRTASDLLDQEFPVGSGMSYRDRLRRIEAERTRQMMQVVRRTYPDGDAPARIAQDLNRSMTYYRPGTPIRGGTAYKQARRIMVSEETRIANAVELATLKGYGIRFAYWRLNPSHRWYGGKEICEVHASRVSYDVVQYLEMEGLSSRDVDLVGLYRIDNYPTYPHPYCKCFPEPFVPPSLQAELDQRRAEIERAARELEEAAEEAERRYKERVYREAQESLGRFEPSRPDALRRAMYRLFGLDEDLV